ncbi:FAD-binding oxidoreductase [Trebonia sp.]|uniref:FAD-binding oxidoreductase n=1 Tax=Trebonia sp. TaxID=2767075 RepID=UPI0026096504|nr:FAD-binding oxidoreductase [Trebonia sp.]
MSGDLKVAGKALAAACQELREGGAADAVGDGVVPGYVASPADTGEAAALLRAAAEHELAVVPRGSGSRLGWGVPPDRCDLLVDTRRMDAVVEHAAGDLVAKVQAGALMNHVLGVLGAAGQEIALDVPGTATVGGVVASGLCGPRRLRYGSPRDLLIGITIVRADGTVAHSGGKVVKNVAGYDLGKLFAGSAGTLGLITEATFRLHPLPAARAFVTVTFPAGAAAADVAAVVALAANSPLVASAVELHRPGVAGPASVGVLVEGSADGVAARAARLADLLGVAVGPGGSGSGAAEVSVSGEPPSWWAGAIEAGDGTLVRVSFWVSALGGVLDAIDAAARDAGAAPLVYGSAGAGVLYLDCGAEPGVAAGFVGALRGTSHGVLRGASGQARGGVVVLAAPRAVRSALAAHGGMAGTVLPSPVGTHQPASPVGTHQPALGVMRAVKDQFDPGRRMAPGRFPEGI